MFYSILFLFYPSLLLKDQTQHNQELIKHDSNIKSAFEIVNVYCTCMFVPSPYQALTITSPNKGKLQDVKKFHFLPSLQKVDWSLSHPKTDKWCWGVIENMQKQS